MEKEKKLSKYAYGGIAGKDYVPYVTDGRKRWKCSNHDHWFDLGSFVCGIHCLFGYEIRINSCCWYSRAIIGSALVAVFAEVKVFCQKI